MKIEVDGKSYQVERGRDSITVDNAIYRIRVESRGLTRTVFVNDFAYQIELPDNYLNSSALTVQVDGRHHAVEIGGKLKGGPPPAAPRASAAPTRGPAPAGAVTAAIAGRIVSLAVEVGQAIEAGQVLLVLEAMKMENELIAPKGGIVKEIVVAPGTRVNEGDVLIVIE